MTIESLLEAASQHHGLLRVDMAKAHGVTRERLDRLRVRGFLTFEGHNVYRVTGSQATWRQQVLRGVWATGAAGFASHRTAAALWGLCKGRGIEVIVPKGSGARPTGVTVHETRHLTGLDVDEHDGVRVTSIERTLVDLAAVLPMGRLARLLDRAHEQELTTYQRVHERLTRMPTRGRKGTVVLRVLLEERIGTPAEAVNTFEEIMVGILACSDLPQPVRQQRVDSGEERYYLDFAWPQHMVALECDGLESHGSPAAMAYDLHRQNRIIEAGWNLRRFNWSAVRFDPRQTIETIRRALVASGWRPKPTRSEPAPMQAN